jgi:hypothetical protein
MAMTQVEKRGKETERRGTLISSIVRFGRETLKFLEREFHATVEVAGTAYSLKKSGSVAISSLTWYRG